MKCLFLITLSFFLVTEINAQKVATSEVNVNSNDTLQSHVEKLYTKLILSDEYQYADEVNRVYMIQIHFLMYRDELESSENFNVWVHKNLYKTEFKSTAEADEAFKKFNEAWSACDKDHSEYYNLLPVLLATEEGMEIWKNAVIAVAKKYPDKFRRAPLSKLVKMY